MNAKALLQVSASLALVVTAYLVGKTHGEREQHGRQTLVDRGNPSDSATGLISENAVVKPVGDNLDASDPVGFQFAFAYLLRSLTPGNAKAEIETFRSNYPDHSRAREFRILCIAWGKMDGLRAATHAYTKEGTEGESMLRSVIEGWALTDPDAATRWVDSGEWDSTKPRPLRALLQGMCQKDPDAASAFAVARIDGGKMKASFISHPAQCYWDGGAEAAVAWLDSLPSGDARTAAIGWVMPRWMETRVDETISWVLQCNGDELPTNVIVQVARELAKRDIDQAVGWIGTFPDGTRKGNGISSIMDVWIERDPEAARDFLAGMPSSHARDNGVAAYSRYLADHDPISALAWAESISEGDPRSYALANAATVLGKDDPAAAAAWLQTCDLKPWLIEDIADAIEDGVELYP